MSDIKLTAAQEQALRLAAQYPNVKSSWYWVGNGANALTLNPLQRKGLLVRHFNTKPARFSITDAGRQWLEAHNDSND